MIYQCGMVYAGMRHWPGRAVVSALLGYVLLLQLIVSGMAGADHTARTLSLLASFDPHALCLSEAGSKDRSSDSAPGAAHHCDRCCTLACRITLFAPLAAAIIAFRAMTEVAHSTSDFRVRPSTAPPRSGGGPRAPPSDLV